MRGKKTRIRTWDPGDNKWNYTSAGVLWATHRQIELVVEIPTIIKGRNASTGKKRERVAWFPYEMKDLAVENIFVKESLTPRQRADKVREMILARATDSKGVVFEASGEVHRVDPNREFRASARETHMMPRGPVTSTVVHKKIPTVIDRIAGACPQKLEWLPYPDGLCKEAFNNVDDKCCVVRQMVEALEGYELAEIMDNMDDIQEKVYPEKTNTPFGKKSWREFGVTPRMVLAWCQDRKIPCTILHGSTACDIYEA